MVTGAYGRQWVHPEASLAFSQDLLRADRLSMAGKTQEALLLYAKEASSNKIAQRRLNIAKKQLKKSSGRAWQGNSFDQITIAFIDWYPGFFDQDVVYMTKLFLLAGLNVSVTQAAIEADILIAGCYGHQLLTNSSLSEDKLVIFLTGENLSPSYNIHDFSITTRNRSFCEKNIRLPQWLGELSFDSGKILFKNPATKHSYNKNASRDLMFSAIYNNSTPEREEILACLRDEFGTRNVHVFGSQRNGEVDKLKILSRSVVNICFENSIGEGYVTEKLLHARAMGCKALYWGHSSYKNDFNEAGIYNTHDAHAIDDVIFWCRQQLQQCNATQISFPNVDTSIFAGKPESHFNFKRLAEWCNLVLSWRRT
jgi:hypothetical protein